MNRGEGAGGSIRPPKEGVWTPLVEALTWMRDRDARDLGEHLERIANSVELTLDGLSEKLRNEALTRLRYGFTQVGEPEPPVAVVRAKERTEASRSDLQREWQKLADVASTGLIEIRGKRIGHEEEVQLTADDLRNCRFLSWLPDGPRRELVARVERIDGTDDPFDGEWGRLHDQRNAGFQRVFVHRERLLKVCPVPSCNWPLANERLARPWLADRLKQLSPKSVSKAKILEEMTSELPMSDAAANRVWGSVTDHRDFAEWTKAGRKSRA